MLQDTYLLGLLTASTIILSNIIVYYLCSAKIGDKSSSNSLICGSSVWLMFKCWSTLLWRSVLETEQS